MRRSKESQKARLLNELSPSRSTKKIIATRGTNALVGDYKKTKRKQSNVSIVALLGAWIVVSSFLWFAFLDSFYSLVGLNAIGITLIAVLKKFVIKEESYQMISKVEKSRSLDEAIADNNHLFSEAIKAELEQIVQNIQYLEKFINQDLMDIEQEHYVSRCKEKHLIDLFNSLSDTHAENLVNNQGNVLEQLKAMNGKLKRIVSTIQGDIEVKIKVKAAFSKDNP